MTNQRNSEYHEFLTNEPIPPPDSLSKVILEKVRRDLRPTHRVVFAKLIVVQGFIGLLTLLFCPQFSLSLTNNYDLFHLFHDNFGHNICMTLCGGIFLGSGGVFASFLLTHEEVKKVRQSKALYYLAASSVFLSVFMLLGVDIYLEIALFWILGAVCFGAASFELSSSARVVVRKMLE